MISTIISTLLIFFICSFLILMVYKIRSIAKGTPSWIINFSVFTIYVVVLICLVFKIAQSFPLVEGKYAVFISCFQDLYSLSLGLSSYEYSLLMSNFISKYVLYPLLLLETLLYVLMSLYLLWTWYSTGQWDTIVNKLISIQALCGIIITLGRVVDYFFRLYGLQPSFMLPTTYCSCWLVFYKFFIYIFQTSHLSMAVVRWVCVKFPLDFHAR